MIFSVGDLTSECILGSEVWVLVQASLVMTQPERLETFQSIHILTELMEGHPRPQWVLEYGREELEKRLRKMGR